MQTSFAGGRLGISSLVSKQFTVFKSVFVSKRLIRKCGYLKTDSNSWAVKKVWAI